MLKTERKLENGALFFALEGELDTLSSPDLTQSCSRCWRKLIR